MQYLRERGLDMVIPSLRQPVLGICLGMQLMCSFTDENDAECLGIMPYRVHQFRSDALKVPHTGWNTISDLKMPLFAGVPDGSRVYFVHGYYVEKGQDTTAVTDYSREFSAALSRRNFHAVQFHPEKSGDVGAKILENFLNL